MKKKLFIPGGGYADIPIIKAAKKLGYYVVTGGLDKNGLGNHYSDLFYETDNSNKEAVLATARKLKIDILCPSAAGLSAVSCAYAAEQLGHHNLDSYIVAKTLHYKDSFLQFARENGIKSPKAQSFLSIDTANKAVGEFNLPFIVKPADLSGGKGIIKVTDMKVAKTAIKNAFDRSRIKSILIEEFIDGSNHGFSALIMRGKVVFYFFDNEYYYINKYTVAGASTPGDVPRKVIKQIICEIEKIAFGLRLKDGIFHLQFILNDNKPYIIDICRRVPGDLYVDFVKIATGIDYPLYIVKAFIGMPIDDIEQKFSNGYYTRHVIMSNKNGRLRGIKLNAEIKGNIIEKLMTFKNGVMINDFMTQRLGIVFLKYGSKNELEAKNGRIHELIKVVVEE